MDSLIGIGALLALFAGCYLFGSVLEVLCRYTLTTTWSKKRSLKLPRRGKTP